MASLWPICRCRLLSSTVSLSTMASVPTPEPARCRAHGHPSPPAPTTSTLLLRRRCCPAPQGRQPGSLFSMTVTTNRCNNSASQYMPYFLQQKRWACAKRRSRALSFASLSINSCGASRDMNPFPSWVEVGADSFFHFKLGQGHSTRRKSKTRTQTPCRSPWIKAAAQSDGRTSHSSWLMRNSGAGCGAVQPDRCNSSCRWYLSAYNRPADQGACAQRVSLQSRRMC